MERPALEELLLVRSSQKSATMPGNAVAAKRSTSQALVIQQSQLAGSEAMHHESPPVLERAISVSTQPLAVDESTAGLGAAANCPLSLGLSSSDLLPNFQKLRLLDFGVLSGSAGAASDISVSAEDLEEAGKAPGNRGVRDPRDSAAPRSSVFTDCCCCAVDIFDMRGQT